jgi:hypothetical protein
LAVVHGRGAAVPSAFFSTSAASITSLRLFSANLSSGSSSPREIGAHQKTIPLTQGVVDFIEGVRSSPQQKKTAERLGVECPHVAGVWR